MKKITPSLLLSFMLFATMLHARPSSIDTIKTEAGIVTIQPIHHATMVISYGSNTIYVDPTGGSKAFRNFGNPNIILITDIHPDHFSIETLKALETQNTTFVVPQAVAKQMPTRFNGQLTIINNGETIQVKGIKIHAMPMYNLPPRSDAYHVKGRGNGYILTLGDKKFYIAGDTEGIPEMRSLQDIYVAFIPMNIPYTMGVEQAADAVLDFEPAIVYPYHYRGSNIHRFKKLVNKVNPKIEVRLRDWYPHS